MEDLNVPVAHKYESVSFGDWMLTMLLCAIPLVNIIMLFVWAFGSSTNPSKANWAKASLLWAVIAVVLWVVVFGALFASFYHGFK
jgi:heme/copper-type cytochrome/quinol oxidase subunit 2